MATEKDSQISNAFLPKAYAGPSLQTSQIILRAWPYSQISHRFWMHHVSKSTITSHHVSQRRWRSAIRVAPACDPVPGPVRRWTTWRSLRPRVRDAMRRHQRHKSQVPSSGDEGETSVRKQSQDWKREASD